MTDSQPQGQPPVTNPTTDPADGADAGSDAGSGVTADPDFGADADFAGEHEDTAVSKDITSGTDDAEPEAPGGSSGMEPTD